MGTQLIFPSFLRLCHEVIFFFCCCCCGGFGGVCGVCWTCVGEGVWGGDVQHQAERTDCWGLCGCVWTRGRGSDAGVRLFVCGYGGDERGLDGCGRGGSLDRRRGVHLCTP